MTYEAEMKKYLQAKKMPADEGTYPEELMTQITINAFEELADSKSTTESEEKIVAHPVLDTIKLIEDRIAELLKSGDLDDEDSCGYPTEKTSRAIGQHRFLMNLSTNLQAFYEGVF